MRWLQEHGVTIWDEWAGEDGDLGPVYGVQWRSWPTPDGGHIDQIAEVVSLLEDPDSRRIIVSAWNVAELPKMALMPCHAFFQFYVGGRQGSAASSTSAAPTSSSACRSTSRATRCSRTCSRSSASSSVGDFVWTGGDCHIYDNHREQVETQLARAPFPYPTLALRRRPPTIFDYAYEDFEVARLRAPPGDQGARRGMRISLVAAVARNGVIGRGGAIPWRLPEDMSSSASSRWATPS